MTKNERYILDEMDLCRKYCSAILKERQQKGFMSLKYPLIQEKVNRYFPPEFRHIMAEECNLIGYMDIPPIEHEFDLEPYEEEKKKIIIELDITVSEWQQKMFDDRTEKRKEAEVRKALVNKRIYEKY